MRCFFFYIIFKTYSILLIEIYFYFVAYIIAWPEPNNKYIMHPNASITAINKKTTGQLCVTCKMCPEKYTPRKPEKK